MTTSNFYVYVHKRLGSGVPFYVGKGHGDRANRRDSRSSHWKNIVAKDGGRDVQYIAKDIDEELAFLIEIESIDQYRRFGIPLINLTDGGDGPTGRIASEATRLKLRARIMTPEWRAKMGAAKLGKKLSAEHREKLSRALKANKYARTRPSMKGFVHSAGSRAKMAASGKEKVFAEEHRRNISLSLIGNSWNKGRKNGPPSEETKIKIGAALKGRKASAETIERLRRCHLVPVQCVETGVIFESALAATLHLGLKHKQQVNACCNGRVKQVRGFTFRYALSQ